MPKINKKIMLLVLEILQEEINDRQTWIDLNLDKHCWEELQNDITELKKVVELLKNAKN